MKSIYTVLRFTQKALICAFVGLLFFQSGIDGQINSPLYQRELESLSVRTIEGIKAHFEVVTVTTQADQAQGLMHVRHLPLNQGMVFSYSRAQVLSMWMKNTHISLDMWFVDAHGRITKVVTHTVPHSLTSIKSDTPVRSVIEVNAGLSSLLGVTKGAVVKHRVFRQD